MKDYVGKSVVANLFRGREGVGGKIWFHENYLEFKSHALNIQRGNTQIEYSDIDSITKHNTWGFIPNQIRIAVKSGETYKFILYNRNKIIEFLMSR